MKKGITLTVLVASLVIMATIISTTIIYSTSSISTANYERFKYEFVNVSNFVNAYYLENNELPVTNEIISPITISNGLNNEVISNGDSDNNLRILNINLLKNLNIKMGKGNFENKDIFVVSENSHNIYYLKGYKYKGKVIYRV